MSTVAKAIATALIAISLTGCSTLKGYICDAPKDTPETVFVEMTLPERQSLELDIIQWTVLTPENAAQKFADLKQQGIDPVFFGLTDKQFEGNSLNMEKIQGEMLLLRDEIDQLETYYSDLEKRLNVTK